MGENIARIRRDRGFTVRQLSERLATFGLKVSPSTVTEIEKATRKVSVDELLIISIALNSSPIQILTPDEGHAIVVAEGVDPIPGPWLEGWFQGETPWPPDADQDEYFRTSSDTQQAKQRAWRRSRPELLEIAGLRSAVIGALDGPDTPLNNIDDPKIMAQHLRSQVERVGAYVRLLADKLDADGYGG